LTSIPGFSSNPQLNTRWRLPTKSIPITERNIAGVPTPRGFRRATPFSVVFLYQAGSIEDVEMSRTFNMGIGMVLVVTEEASRKILEEGQHKAYRIGEVVCGEGVRYC